MKLQLNFVFLLAFVFYLFIYLNVGEKDSAAGQDRQPTPPDGFRLPVRIGQCGRNAHHPGDAGTLDIWPQDSGTASQSLARKPVPRLPHRLGRDR